MHANQLDLATSCKSGTYLSPKDLSCKAGTYLSAKDLPGRELNWDLMCVVSALLQELDFIDPAKSETCHVLKHLDHEPGI